MMYVLTLAAVIKGLRMPCPELCPQDVFVRI